jgi:transposase
MSNRKSNNTQISTRNTKLIDNLTRRKAVETAMVLGQAEAARLFKVSKGSIHNWYQKDAIAYHRAQSTKIAKEYKSAVEQGEGSFTKNYKNSILGLEYDDNYRRRVVLYAADFGVTKATKDFSPSKATIYKWLRSFNLDGYYFAK